MKLTFLGTRSEIDARTRRHGIEDACALQKLRDICMHFRIGFTKRFGEW